MADVNINANVKSNVGDVGKSAGAAAGEFTVMGVSINSVKAGLKSMAAMAKASFATMKAAIISTGIGALILAVISLLSYFKNTQKGAEMLERAFAGFGAVVGEVSDLFAKVGETMVNAFSDPKQAIKDLWESLKKNLMNRVTGLIDTFGALGKVIKSTLSLDWEGAKEGAKEYGQALVQVGTGMDVEQQKAFADGLKNIAKEMDKDVQSAMRLKGIMQGIRREEMDFTKVQAQSRQDVAKARLLAMDESKSQEERLKAINSVMKEELKMTADIIEMQKRKVEAKREELTLNKTMIEDEEALAQLEVELIDLTTKSTMTQKRLMLEVETLTLEMEVDRKAKEKARLKSQKQDAIALSQFNLTRLKDETDEAFKIRMDAAKEEQKLALASAKILAGLSKDNMLAEIDNLKERALKKLEIEHEAKLEELKDHENFEELKLELDKKYARDRENVTEATSRSLKQLSENEVAWADMTADEKLSIASNTAGTLAKVLGEETAAGKAMAITQATIDTYKAAQASYASMSGIPVVGPVLGGIAAAAAIASGIANVKAIASTGDGGGGAGSISAGGSGGGAPPNVPAPQMMSGEFELGGGIKPEPVKAFVVTDEMTNSQNQLSNIRRRATI